MKKETRSLVELYQVMIDNIDLLEDGGMCNLSVLLYYLDIITYKELEIIRWDLVTNKPSDSGTYWFPRGEKQPRLEWMQNRINQFKNE